MGFRSGAYNWSFDEKFLGIAADAPLLTTNMTGQPVTADLFGGEPIDEIKTGLTGTLQIVLQEADEAGLISLLNAFGIQPDVAGIDGQAKNFGCSMTGTTENKALANVLKGKVSEFSTCHDPNKHTFLAYRAALASNTPIEQAIGGRLQQVPLLFNLWPYIREVGAQPVNRQFLYEWFLDGSVPTNGAELYAGATSLQAFTPA